MTKNIRYFAELNFDNRVLRIIAVGNSDCSNQNGVFDEKVGEIFCQNHTKSSNRWLECSTDGSVRGRHKSVDQCFYSPDLDKFVPYAPYPSWTLDSDGEWQPPIPEPARTSDTINVWEEITKSWKTIPKEKVQE